MRRSNLQTFVGRALMTIRAARMRPTGVCKARIGNIRHALVGRRTDAHRDLDAAVAAAYGGPDTSEDEALTKLLELKLSRAGASTAESQQRGRLAPQREKPDRCRVKRPGHILTGEPVAAHKKNPPSARRGEGFRL
jgi:hypothetical protein